MKRFLVASAWLAAVLPAAATTNLPQLLADAYRCSDVSLESLAASTCDSPPQIAAMAVSKCQDKWSVIADKALGSPPATVSSAEHEKAVARYTESIEIEYTHTAELKAIDMRTRAGRCGFD